MIPHQINICEKILCSKMKETSLFGVLGSNCLRGEPLPFFRFLVKVRIFPVINEK